MDPVRIRTRAQQDVASGHSGTKVIGDLRTLLHQSDNLTITGSVSSTWADQDYMNSYFGINPVQSRLSGMPVFDAGSGIKDVRLSLGSNYTFSDDWALVANLGYKKLLADAKNSPVVDLRGSANQFSAGLFAVYSF